MPRSGFELGVGAQRRCRPDRRTALPIRLVPPTMNVKENRKTFSYSAFYEQAPEGSYVALVPALPGCHIQGATLEETERRIKEAAR